MNLAAKAVTGGVLALLGLALIKFLLGMFGAALAFMFFFMAKVLPFILIGMVVVWLFRRVTRKKASPAA